MRQLRLQRLLERRLNDTAHLRLEHVLGHHIAWSYLIFWS